MDEQKQNDDLLKIIATQRQSIATLRECVELLDARTERLEERIVKLEKREHYHLTPSGPAIKTPVVKTAWTGPDDGYSFDLGRPSDE